MDKLRISDKVMAGEWCVVTLKPSKKKRQQTIKACEPCDESSEQSTTDTSFSSVSSEPFVMVENAESPDDLLSEPFFGGDLTMTESESADDIQADTLQESDMNTASNINSCCNTEYGADTSQTADVAAAATSVVFSKNVLESCDNIVVGSSKPTSHKERRHIKKKNSPKRTKDEVPEVLEPNKQLVEENVTSMNDETHCHGTALVDLEEWMKCLNSKLLTPSRNIIQEESTDSCEPKLEDINALKNPPIYKLPRRKPKTFTVVRVQLPPEDEPVSVKCVREKRDETFIFDRPEGKGLFEDLCLPRNRNRQRYSSQAVLDASNRPRTATCKNSTISPVKMSKLSLTDECTKHIEHISNSDDAIPVKSYKTNVVGKIKNLPSIGELSNPTVEVATRKKISGKRILPFKAKQIFEPKLSEGVGQHPTTNNDAACAVAGVSRGNCSNSDGDYDSEIQSQYHS